MRLDTDWACLQRERFHGKWQYLFIESICNDPAVLEQNYRFKMMYSPDYKDVDTEAVSHSIPSCVLLTSSPQLLDLREFCCSPVLAQDAKPEASKQARIFRARISAPGQSKCSGCMCAPPHYEIPLYSRMCFASTLVVLSNRMVSFPYDVQHHMLQALWRPDQMS